MGIAYNMETNASVIDDDPIIQDSPPKDLIYWEEHPEEVPEGSLAERSIKLLRPDKKGFQDLLVSEVGIAINSGDPVLKLRHICEAFFSLSSKQQELVAPSKDTRDSVERCYKLSIAFGRMPLADWQNYKITEFVAVPFPFKLGADSKMFDFAKDVRSDTIEDMKKWSIEGVPLVLAERYKALFVVYYMPPMIRVLKAIFQHYVSHDLWSVIQERRNAHGSSY